jgi:transcriptional regulator with XRE-family HTH domain
MTSPPDDEARYRAEEERLIAVIAKLAKQQGMSIRAMEARAGVGASVFAKVMSGKVAPSVRHLLRMCDALGVNWSELYRLAGLGQVDEFDERVLAVLRREGLLPAKQPPAQG